MGLQNMQVFNSFAYSSASETIKEQVALFNGATRNGITLSSGSNVGDFDFDTMFKEISGLVTDRNAYGTDTLTPQALEQLKMASVKIAGRTEPVSYTRAQFDWIDQNAEQAGTAFGEQVAVGMMKYMLDRGISAFVAATKEQGDLYTDLTSGKASLASLNDGVRKFGDRAGDIACWVMHSNSLFDIYGSALANSERLFEFGNVRVVQDGFGRPLVMTDSSYLTYDDEGTQKYFQCGLSQGGIYIEDNGNYAVDDDKNVLDENTTFLLKSEFDFNLGLKGYTWDTASGGKSPNSAAVATGTNWEKVATDVKSLAGVLVETL